MLDNSDKYDQEMISKNARINFSSEVIGEKIFEIYKEVITKK